jgi:hypothetical protein
VESYGAAEACEAIAKVMAVAVAGGERLIRDGRITDGFTLAAYARAKV